MNVAELNTAVLERGFYGIFGVFNVAPAVEILENTGKQRKRAYKVNL